MAPKIDHRSLYRLPWSLTDNGISWLEPTAHCNLACDGCYRNNRVEHKSMEETRRELELFARLRNSDALSIAGGDPLLYPQLLETVREAKARGYKPVVNTNGQALTAEMVDALAEAGLSGFTFHVDSKQGRKGEWKGKDELELNALRERLAELAARADLSCAFNATIYPDTIEQIGPLSKWAAEHIDRVQVMVFILYRDVVTGGYDYFAGQERVPFGEGGAITYNLDVEKGARRRIKAEDAVAELMRADPRFRPSAYLNGTEDPSSFKWLLAGRVGRPGEVFGYVGPKFQELVQAAHHLVAGKYLAYAPRASCRLGKPTLLGGLFDRGLRAAAGRFALDAARAPWRAVREPLHFQSVLIIQPIDVLPDGRMNMCDGCPDITVHEDRLVWSCRMDEIERYGTNLVAAPRGRQ